jgi:glutaredoxin
MITLYTKPQCPYCDQAKAWFTRNGIDYKSVNVAEDEVALAMIKEQGHRSVPQIYLNGELFVEGGYSGLSKMNPEVLKEQIELRG